MSHDERTCPDCSRVIEETGGNYVEPLIHPIEWATAVDTSGMKRVGPQHRLDPRCAELMPTDARCDCGVNGPDRLARWPAVDCEYVGLHDHQVDGGFVGPWEGPHTAESAKHVLMLVHDGTPGVTP